MASGQIMRSEILQVYTSKSWKAKVKVMSDAQVLAIYTNFVKTGRIK